MIQALIVFALSSHSLECCSCVIPEIQILNLLTFVLRNKIIHKIHTASVKTLTEKYEDITIMLLLTSFCSLVHAFGRVSLLQYRTKSACCLLELSYQLLCLSLYVLLMLS